MRRLLCCLVPLLLASCYSALLYEACDTCDAELQDWSRAVVERCLWMEGRPFDEVEERFHFAFPELEELADRPTVESSDGVLEVKSSGCSEPDYHSESDYCTAGPWAKFDYYDPSTYGFLCLDGGARDAGLDDKGCPTPDANFPMAHWVCEHCEHGIQACCFLDVWFLDEPEACRDRSIDCDNLERHQDKLGCTIYVNYTTRTVREITGTDPWLTEWDPRCVPRDGH